MPTDDDSVKTNPNSPDQQKRDQFMRSRGTLNERKFWRLFFLEIDKRTFVKATFQAAEFGVYIHNTNHLSSSGGKYSLMYTRNGAFNMNDTPFEGQEMTAMDRLKHWCTTEGLPEQFYAELTSSKILTSPDHIDIRKLVEESAPENILRDLFVCIDLFQK